MKRTHLCAAVAALIASSGTVAIAPRAAGAASVRHATPTCSLSAQTLGGAQVIFFSMSGLQHNAWFQIEWSEPQITQVQHMWSTSTGVLQDDVMNDQGSGTYTASVWSLDRQGNPALMAATCSLSV